MHIMTICRVFSNPVTYETINLSKVGFVRIPPCLHPCHSKYDDVIACVKYNNDSGRQREGKYPSYTPVDTILKYT